MVASYGELARARGALRRRAARALGSRARRPRRHRRQELAPTISKCSTASGTPGWRRCRPTPSCTAPSSATFSSIPARASALPPRARRRDRAACAEEPRTADRRRRRRTMRRCSPPTRSRSCRAPATISPGCSTPPAPPAGRRARCSRTAIWSLASKAYAAEVDAVAPGDAILHAAPMSHGSGLYIMPHVGAARRASHAGVAAASSRTKSSRCSALAAALDVRRADHDQAAGRLSGRLRRRATSARSSGAARRCMSRTRCAALDRFGPRLAQIYGQGESPMTITTLSKQDIADRDHPRWRERLGSAGRPYACVEVMVADARGPRRCRRARPAKSSAAATS